jgi:GH24 family phage-related lysozyme (muramidase)
VNDDFVSYLKDVEGSVVDTKTGLLRDYMDQAGNKTAGYGHMVDADSGEFHWTDEEATAVLVEDARRAEDQCRSFVNLNYGTATFERLPMSHQRALVDIEFNVRGGVAKYPKFTRALIAGDRAAALAEHERFAKDKLTGEKVPLQRRNKKFVETFLSNPKEFADL